MHIKVGPPVSEDNFFPRPTLISRLIRALETSHVAFLGPRRTGKTSCLRKLLAHPPTGYVPILLNLEHYDRVESWLTAMLDGVRVELKKPGPNAPWLLEKGAAFLNRIEELTIAGQGIKLAASKEKTAPWRHLADDFLRLLQDTNPPILFLLDEFPVFLNLIARKHSRDEIEALLNWFRSSRQSLGDHSPRFLVTGSIGLKAVVRRLGLSPTINDFDTIEIPPLSDNDALKFLATLARNNEVPLSATGCRHILGLLGSPWPILLQLFISEIKEACLPKAPTKADLDRLYRERLVAGPRNEYCAGMYTRLREAFSEAECRLAREILKTLCRTPAGLSRNDFESIHERLVPLAEQRTHLADQLDYVLDTLKHDGYLHQDFDGSQRTRFASHILRDYWLLRTS